MSLGGVEAAEWWCVPLRFGDKGRERCPPGGVGVDVVVTTILVPWWNRLATPPRRGEG